MNLKQRRAELTTVLAEQRDIQRQAQQAIDNARAAEHQVLGAIAMIDEMEASTKTKKAREEEVDQE